MTATDLPAVNGTTQTGADQAAVAGVAQQIVAAWAQQDGDAFADVFTEDGTMVLPGDVYKKGREEIRAFMSAAFQGPYKGTQVTGTPLGLRLVTPDVGIMVTQGGVKQPGEADVAPEREIRATWVVVRQGSTWKLAAYHNSPVRVP